MTGINNSPETNEIKEFEHDLKNIMHEFFIFEKDSNECFEDL